jgi:hypothetical protein
LPHRIAAALRLATLIALLPPAFAVEPLVTDRPDFTNSPITVPSGRVQVEAGFTYTDLDDTDAEILTIGEVLGRLGLTDAWELQVGIGSWVDVDTDRNDESGLSNGYLGAKWNSVIVSDAIGGEFGVLFGTGVPTGDGDVASDEFEPSVVAAAGWALGDALSLGTNVGYARPDDGSDRFDQFFASASLGIGVTDRFGAFVEAYGFTEESEQGDATLYGNAGVTYLLGPDLQLDARIGTGLNDEADTDIFVGAGVSARF